MNLEHALWLTAFLACAAGTNAQTCSGGPAGGADAAGCQCSVAEADLDDVHPRTWAQLSARLVRQSPAPAAVIAPAVASIHSAGMSATGTSVASTASVGGGDSASVAVHSCSGGVDGGMDANGNQCSAIDDSGHDLDAAARARLFERLAGIQSNGTGAPQMMPAKLQQ